MAAEHPRAVATDGFTLHRRAWRGYRRLPRLARIWIVLAVLGVLVKVVVLSGSGEEHEVKSAVTAAVRDATGPDPASSCSALSPQGLSQFLGAFGGEAASAASDPLLACRMLVVQLRAQATPEQLSEFARGSVRSVQFRGAGVATVIYLAAGGKLGAELDVSQRNGRWLIDSVAGGTTAGSE